MKMFHCDVVIASSETIAKHIYNNTGNLTPNRITTTIRPRIRRATTVTKYMSADIYHRLMVMIRLNSVIGVDAWDIVITIKISMVIRQLP